jgi:hypothetical protein
MMVRIGPAGLLIGRHNGCDVQLMDESASRRHALLRVVPDGVELIALGRHPVLVDGRSAAPVERVAAGATLGFPGLVCRVRMRNAEDTVPVAYSLRHDGNHLPIRTTPYVVGSGAATHVQIAGWPDEAFRIHLAQNMLYVELLAETALHNGAEIAPGAPVTLSLGDELRYRGEAFVIEQAAAGSSSTLVGEIRPRAVAAVLEPLPRGGRLTLAFADGDRKVYLPGRRFQLISTLLLPPPPHAAGDYVPDSEVIPLVWSDTDEVGGRKDVNVLLSRCRHDLIAAGISPTDLIERAPGGRATRIVLAPGATVRSAPE